MSRKDRCPCAQSERALRLLISPDGLQIDRKKLREVWENKTPDNATDFKQLLIQIVLALLEGMDKEGKEKDDKETNDFEQLKSTARQTARDTVAPDILRHDLPLLIASIRSIAALIPTPGFRSTRIAREAMRMANNLALADTAVNWLVWSDAVRTEMDLLSEDDELTSLLQYRNAWLAIADALSTIR